MITIKEDTTIVGISEFRTHIDEILEESKKHRVLIGRRNKPVAVLINMEKFHQMESTLDLLEDFALGFLAKESSVLIPVFLCAADMSFFKDSIKARVGRLWPFF